MASLSTLHDFGVDFRDKGFRKQSRIRDPAARKIEEPNIMQAPCFYGVRWKCMSMETRQVCVEK
ncbi:hypothetical protein JHK85_041363 [Glycine max]|nr:hypothetical protein JHK85_041363 [Glycine max]